MSNPILTVFDDAGNAIAIPAFPWVTEGGWAGRATSTLVLPTNMFTTSVEEGEMPE